MTTEPQPPEILPSLSKILRGKQIVRFCQDYTIRERALGYPGNERTIGREQLYEAADGGYWLREEYYSGNAKDRSDTVIPLTKDGARAWLKDRFGWWKRFARLESRVFGSGE